jgi:hypothetical protein
MERITGRRTLIFSVVVHTIECIMVFVLWGFPAGVAWKSAGVVGPEDREEPAYVSAGLRVSWFIVLLLHALGIMLIRYLPRSGQTLKRHRFKRAIRYIHTEAVLSAQVATLMVGMWAWIADGGVIGKRNTLVLAAFRAYAVYVWFSFIALYFTLRYV